MLITELKLAILDWEQNPNTAGKAALVAKLAAALAATARAAERELEANARRDAATWKRGKLGYAARSRS